jgi:hypothetical protein
MLPWIRDSIDTKVEKVFQAWAAGSSQSLTTYLFRKGSGTRGELGQFVAYLS